MDVLQSQLATGRLHHAYIFRGPAGVGKFTTALAMARVLLCHDRRTGSPGAGRGQRGPVIACGQCISCQQMPASAEQARHLRQSYSTGDAASPQSVGPVHPDFHLVVKELARFNADKRIRERKQMSIPVEVLRSALLEPVHRTARLRGGKVFVVDEAELLSSTGQNLLLKTLEEPPAGTTIILVTSSEDRLLATVRSRCQRLAFVPLVDSCVGRWLDEHVGGLDPQQRARLVQFASGSLGRAELAIEYELARWGSDVLPAIDGFAQGQPDGGLGRRILALINAFASAWVERHPGASKQAANKLGADLMWSMIADHARGQLSKVTGRHDSADPAAAEARVTPWLGVIEALAGAQRLLDSNVNTSLVCDHLVVEVDHCFSGQPQAVAAGQAR